MTEQNQLKNPSPGGKNGDDSIEQELSEVDLSSIAGGVINVALDYLEPHLKDKITELARRGVQKTVQKSADIIGKLRKNDF